MAKEKQSFSSDLMVQSVMIEARSLGEKVQSLEIVDSATQNISTDLMADVKEKIKVIEERRKYFSAPLNEILDGINEQARQFKTPLNTMLSNLAEKKRAYMALQAEAQRKANEVEQKRMAKAIEKDKPYVPKPIPQVDKKVQTESGVTESIVDDWKIQVMNSWEFIKFAVAENLIDCIEVNEGAVKRYAKSFKGNKQIPGIRCYNEPSIRTRMS